ncbi:DUF6212 domain-containing protein, partial [Roseomonas sp. GC11]|uniref:DUF6212 domain-containing protein n=1 Tax=Roseomonas sp. GC11 TaxID=2950546 RepID=UPI0021095461
MSGVLVLPADLGALMGGGPALILGADLPEAEALEIFGVTRWLARRLPGGDLWLYPCGAASGGGVPEGLITLAWAPAGVLAVIEPEAARLEAWAEWWEATGQPAPHRLQAARGGEALPGLAALLAEALIRANDRAVGLQRSLVALRQEHEATREALGHLTRRMAHQPPAVPRLVLSTEPGPQQIAPAGGGGLFRLRQPLGVRLDGLARLAVHVAAADA